jgi:hypothetical protein
VVSIRRHGPLGDAAGEITTRDQRKVVWLAHPVAPTDDEIGRELASLLESPLAAELRSEALRDEGRRRAVSANLHSALVWLDWLVEHTPWAICAPWIPYVEVHGDDGGSMRQRGLVDNCAIAERCDAIALCGVRISSGMDDERGAVMRGRGGVLDLTPLGRRPPSGPWHDVLAGELERALAVAKAR